MEIKTREVKLLASGHTGSKKQSRDLKPRSSELGVNFFSTVLGCLYVAPRRPPDLDNMERILALGGILDSDVKL